jgi:hypothetical protein
VVRSTFRPLYTEDSTSGFSWIGFYFTLKIDVETINLVKSERRYPPTRLHGINSDDTNLNSQRWKNSFLTQGLFVSREGFRYTLPTVRKMVRHLQLMTYAITSSLESYILFTT